MADTVNFFSSTPAYDFDVKAPVAGSERVTQFPRIVMDQAADGSWYAYELNSKDRFEWELRFENLTKTERDNIQNLFNDLKGDTFKYTHSDGTAYSSSVFAMRRLEWDKQGPSGSTPEGDERAEWAITLRLSTPSTIT